MSVDGHTAFGIYGFQKLWIPLGDFGMSLVEQKEIFDMDEQLPLGRRQQWSLETGR